MLKRSKRWSILPAFTIDGYLDYIIHQGSITSEIFNNFIREKVIPHCTRFEDGGPRSVLILDNARIHDSQELLDICNEAGILLEFLAPYSPDLNPIETSFALLKSFIRRYRELAMEYAPENKFGSFLEIAVRSFQGDGDPGKLFRLAGIQYVNRGDESSGNDAEYDDLDDDSESDLGVDSE